MRRALIVYNPMSGRRQHSRKLARIVRALRDGGIDAEPVATNEPGHATELARQAIADRPEIVFGYGGDGTIREVAAGLVDSEVALGVLPGGTVNVVARAFALTTDPVEAARRQCRFEPRRIDVGICAGKPFLMQASSGPEAYAMHRLSTTLKKRLGFLGAVLSSTASILRYPFPIIEIEADGKKHQALGALVCNISELAGPFRLIPDGSFDDGRMELFLFKGRGLGDAVSFCLDLARGAHAKRRDVEIHHVERVVFTGPPGAFVQLDGDALRDVPHPIEMTLAPKRLLALVA